MTKYRQVATCDDRHTKAASDFDHAHVWSGLSYSSIFSYESSADQFRSPFTYGCQHDSQNFTRSYSYGENGTKENSYASNFRPIESLNRLNNEEDLSSNGKWNAIVELTLLLLSYAVVLFTLPFSLFAIIKNIEPFEQLVVFRIGRALKPKGAGINFVLPCIDSYQIVDTREQLCNITAVQISTSDKAVLEIDLVLTYSVKDPIKCVSTVQDYDHVVRSMARTSLQKISSKKNCDDVEKRKKSIEDELKTELNCTTLRWGVEVSKIEFSGLKLIQKAEPAINKILKTLMQPNFASTFWSTLTSGTMNFLPPDPAAVLQSKNLAQLDDFTYETKSCQSAYNLPTLIAKLNTCNRRLLADQIDHVFSISCAELGEFHLNLLRKPSTANQNQPQLNNSNSFAAPALENSFKYPHASTNGLLIANPNPTMAGLEPPLTDADFSTTVPGPPNSGSNRLIHAEIFEDLPLAALGPPNPGSNRLVRVEIREVGDLWAILAGRADPVRLHVQGRLRVLGDISAAKKLKLVAEQVQKSGVIW